MASNYQHLLQKAAGEHYSRFSDIFVQAARQCAQENGVERPLVLEDYLNADRTPEELNAWGARCFKNIAEEKAAKQARANKAKKAGEFVDTAPIQWCDRAKEYAEKWLDGFEGYLTLDEGIKGLHLVAHKPKTTVEQRQHERELVDKMLGKLLNKGKE